MNNARIPAAVRGPSAYLVCFTNLDDIITWAGIKGNPSYVCSQPGSLLYLLAGDEFSTIDAAEFASSTPDHY